MAHSEESQTTITVVRNTRTNQLFFYLDDLDAPLEHVRGDKVIDHIRVDLTDLDDSGSVALMTRFNALLDLDDALEGAVREIVVRVAEAAFTAGQRIRGSPVSC